MSKNLERKLLAECFDAVVNDGDLAKATRLFKRHWDLSAKTQYSLLESADEEFEITDMGDDFNEEISAESSSEEEQYEQVLLALDELEEKYTGENSEELMSKFDEARNCVDELKLSGDEETSATEDLAIVMEEIKADFEMAGLMEDESVAELFEEVDSLMSGAEEEVEVDVADEDEDFEVEEIEEAADIESEMGTDLEFEESDELADETDVEASEEVEVADEEKEESEAVDILYDLEDGIDELIDIFAEEKETVEEGWSNIADPRKKMSSESEGVNKKGTMNFGKLRGLTLDKKAGLGASSSVSKGISADKKAKVQSTENKGAKQWHKVEKPTNKPANGKSLMGK